MNSSKESDGIPSAGTSSSQDAAQETQKVSSELYDLISVKGKASDSSPGVLSCGGKDREKYFRIFHPWSFYPASSSELDDALEQLHANLPKHGWKVVEYGPDTSMNKNISLTADNDEKKHSVNVSHRAKNNPPKLAFFVISGCYQIPDGEEIQRF
ncbi:hypothetical protein ABZ023_01890 [Streptomyces sp. NPDC006367]|uniref:hypothetical protein n=1 Tax=unclassified Streptomyces TaxID=2593676 RepID=UPI0033B460CD